MDDVKIVLKRFEETSKSAGWTSLFPALDEVFQASIGHRLFSCSAYQMTGPEQGVAARIYSSDALNYPVSGLKEIVPNRWSDIVIRRREVFVANTVEDFADVFPDHALIASLGLGSVVNVPVSLRGDFIGTVNLLHEPGFYTDARLQVMQHLSLPAVLAFVSSAGPT